MVWSGLSYGHELFVGDALYDNEAAELSAPDIPQRVVGSVQRVSTLYYLSQPPPGIYLL